MKFLSKLRTCGLMIADLSSGNVNVYQEVGFCNGA